MSDYKEMKLRYAGVCCVCETKIEKGVLATYDRESRKVLCVSCRPVEKTAEPTVADGEQQHLNKTVDAHDEQKSLEEPQATHVYGDAGAAARQELQRRRSKDQEKVLEQHPHLGKLILAFRQEPNHVSAWQKGAVGEERLGSALNKIASERLVVLHDRRIPGSRANIDHLALTSRGLWVIDAKCYKDAVPELRKTGPLFGAKTEELYISGRNRTKLVDGVHHQMKLVEDLVGPSVPVRGALCFIDAKFPLVGGDFTVQGVDVVSRRLLCKRLQKEASEPVMGKELQNLLMVFKSYT